MRVLFISKNFPAEPDIQVHGLFGRLRTLVQGAASSGARLKLLFFVDDLAPYAGTALESWRQRMQTYFGVELELAFALVEPYDPSVRGVGGVLRGAFSMFAQANYARMAGDAQRDAVEKALAENPDLVFVHRLFCMPPLMRARRPLPRVFLDMDDIEHVAFSRSIAQPPVWRSKFLLYLQVPALIRGERQAVRLTEKTFVCSRLDVEKLKAIGGAGRAAVLPNSVAFPPLAPPAEAPTLLFLGTFLYPPNVHAMEYMLDKVWPLVRAQIPAARLVIGGNKPEEIRHFAQPPAGVDFAGFIPSLDDAYAAARAVVCPVLSGGGTRVKIVEAAAYARAVVSTTLGMEGLDFTADKEILIGDTPEAFAAHCVQLLSDLPRAEQIGLAARRKAQTIYDKAAVVERIGAWVAGRAAI
ncbi:MAG: glycosyltransferase [Betaproteobacteria bacterium]